ncbi:type III secretion protein [Epibacterium sp. SM1969]|uniref:Type III secretion protein n=1 Tax=Tritonibacter aquimaris TaxID=2663379 RepID=A0A844AKW6_9RHOB|nr:flagellar biosynthetic protein FliR [Tritonibacter aquimaris]MQY41979.1 type III secretion protein [Tritonibacter aquimaris]
MNIDLLSADVVTLFGFAFWHAAIVFLRVGAMVSVLPAVGEAYVPTPVKLGIAMAFTLIVAPAAPVQNPPDGVLDYAGIAVSEAIIGLALGLAVRIFVFTLQTAGTIAANSTSLSQAFGTAGQEPMPVIGGFLVVAGVTFAVIMGLHIRVAEYMIQSYQLFPVGEFPEASGLLQWIVQRVSQSYTMAFALAAPFVITAVVYNITLGFINKAMPQLMVAFVGAPAITFGGIFILMVASPMILTYWGEALFGFFKNPVGALQ